MFGYKHDVLSSATDHSDVFPARGGSALGWATCRKLTRCCQKQMRSHVPPEICHGPGIIIYILSRTIYTIRLSKRSLECFKVETENKELQLSPSFGSLLFPTLKVKRKEQYIRTYIYKRFSSDHSLNPLNV